MTGVLVNGRSYWPPSSPTAVVCLDGVDPRYLEDAFERRLIPRLAELVEGGSFLHARAQLPSFTNPNNLSIVTGVPPSLHGLPGNHYLAPSGEEVALDRPELLRAPSIHAGLAEAGVRVLAVTTKEKLRRLLAAGGVPCVSAERADEQSLPDLEGTVASLVARAKPGIYDWDCSHYALELALALASRLEIGLLYVSLTDAVQHAAAPGEELSDRYLARLDELVGDYLEAGWQLGPGRRPRHEREDRRRRHAQRALSGRPAPAGRAAQRTRRPADHRPLRRPPRRARLGLLGPRRRRRARRRPGAPRANEGVEEVLPRALAAESLSLPPDRIGDLVVLGDERTVFGKRAADHDLSALRGPLRSHGGRHEQAVPLLVSRRVAAPEAGLSNADVHHLLLGGGR